MAKAQPTSDDKINLAVMRARAGNGRSLAALIGEVLPGDLAEAFGYVGPKMTDEHWYGVVGVLLFAAKKQVDRDRVRAEKLAAQRAARARMKAILDAEYLGGVHVSG